MKQLVIIGGALGAAYLLKSQSSSSNSSASSPAPVDARTDAEKGADIVKGAVSGMHWTSGGIGGAINSAWDFLTPGGLDGVEAAADYVGDKAKKKAESIAWKLAIIGGIALAGFVVYRKVMAP